MSDNFYNIFIAEFPNNIFRVARLTSDDIFYTYNSDKKELYRSYYWNKSSLTFKDKKGALEYAKACKFTHEISKEPVSSIVNVEYSEPLNTQISSEKAKSELENLGLLIS